jgi:hypothetical protein
MNTRELALPAVLPAIVTHPNTSYINPAKVTNRSLELARRLTGAWLDQITRLEAHDDSADENDLLSIYDIANCSLADRGLPKYKNLL